jgi:hypothetical protein
MMTYPRPRIIENMEPSTLTGIDEHLRTAHGKSTEQIWHGLSAGHLPRSVALGTLHDRHAEAHAEGAGHTHPWVGKQ